MNQQMYDELHKLREKYKESGRRKSGRAPLVCTDEALQTMAELCPRKLADLEGIPGIGKAFIDTYGPSFLKVINNYETTENEKTIGISMEAMDILKELEKKLVSLNRRNRLLYMPKLAIKYAFDLASDESLDALKIPFQKKSVSICDLKHTKGYEEIEYRNLVTLLREVNRDARDKGQNDLYIGYPFVIGRLAGEQFDVRCPLALFPVKADRKSTSISIRMDDSRDVIYNSTLLLAHAKCNNIVRPLPQVVVEEVHQASFIKDLVQFYEENGIHLSVEDEVLEKYQDYKYGEFPAFSSGELHLKHQVILGKFPVCSSSIQKDFERMLEEGKMNPLLDELLMELEGELQSQTDIYSEVEDAESNCYFQAEGEEPNSNTREKDLIYINELDSSQENAISFLGQTDRLVIQGPPGTGKSQVISNLLMKCVNEEKTVLLVSEKKTALDVVYSRLGVLSPYAFLIDDVGNKDQFYQQLSSMIALGQERVEHMVSVSSLSAEIDGLIHKLEEVANHLYSPSAFGIEPYRLYQKTKRIPSNDPTAVKEFQDIHNILNVEIRGIPYEELTAIYHKMTEDYLIDKVKRCLQMMDTYPWLSYSNPELQEQDLQDMQSVFADYMLLYKDYCDSKPFLRFFKKGKVKKNALSYLKKYFICKSKELLGVMMSSPEEMMAGFDRYSDFHEVFSVYDELSEREKVYGAVLAQVCQLYEDSEAANKALYNGILYENIMDFEAENPDVLDTIAHFEDICEELSQKITEKRKRSRERLEMILAKNMGNITYGKRGSEIQKIVESKRKWSVNRFITKYDFELFHGIKIWLLTPEVVSEILPFQAGLFDLVIFDEASQMYVEKGLPSIYRAQKVMIAGDHKQLRPSSLGGGRIDLVGEDEDLYVEEKEPKTALEEGSLLDLARFRYPNVMLNYHYRSRYEELIAFSNYAFYKGRLYVAPNVKAPMAPPIEYHKMEEAVWVDRSNEVEADYIISLLKDILQKREKEETIGIITFNTKQRELILDKLDDQCDQDPIFAQQIEEEQMRRKDGEDIGLFVKNIESVQGDERDIIIFSIGYAKNASGRMIYNFGWLNQRGGENRLNVAISRAKQKVHVVASFLPEELEVEHTKNDGPKILKKYLQYAYCISQRDTEGAKEILESFCEQEEESENIYFDSNFETEVYYSLCERLEPLGYTVESRVGVGGYCIDMAVCKEGKHVLGIECDGLLYQKYVSARERDYHRRKYLEIKGWKMHRVWSTNWWRDSKAEIERIVKRVEAYTSPKSEG